MKIAFITCVGVFVRVHKIQMEKKDASAEKITGNAQSRTQTKYI